MNAHGGRVLPAEHVPQNCFLHDMISVARKGERRWKSTCGKRIYTWDALHEEVEVYNARGRHLGAMDPETGRFIKDAVKGRKIDV